MPGRYSFGRTLVVAVAAHVAFLGFLSCLHPRAASPVEAPMVLVPVELATETPPPEAAPVEPVAPAPHQPALPAEPSRTPRSVSAPTAATVESAVPLTAPEEAPPSTWTVPVIAPGASPTSDQAAMARLGLDGKNHFMGRQATPKEEARAAADQANRAAGAAIRDALHEHDMALGLGGSGPVTAALETVVRESGAPGESTAVLIAVADASGHVTSVTVERSSDQAAFQVVADELLKRLEAQTIRVPSGGHGLAMRVSVASKIALPSGGGVGIDPKHAALQFDVADLAARPRRVVHARVLDEQIL